MCPGWHLDGGGVCRRPTAHDDCAAVFNPDFSLLTISVLCSDMDIIIYFCLKRARCFAKNH